MEHCGEIANAKTNRYNPLSHNAPDAYIPAALVITFKPLVK